MSRALPFTLDTPSLLHKASLLDGNWVQSKSGQRFDVEENSPLLIKGYYTDPGTGKVFASCPTNTVADVDAYIKSAQRSFLTYRATNPRERAKMLLNWHSLITRSKNDIATLVVYETGKPMAEALGEVEYALGFAWWFAGEAERIRGSIAQPSISDEKKPRNQAADRSAALAAGCTIVIKPSPETPLSVLALADLALQAGLPPGVMNVLSTDSAHTPSVSEALCKHQLVRKVTFTGSTTVGQLIARHCSEGLKKVTLELGGNCPFIVFDDGDLDQALAALMVLKWRTAGQACTHANRVYVQSGVYDRFLSMLVDATRRLRVGHGADPETTIGALTTKSGLVKLERHIADAVAKGGKIVLGGRPLEHLGGNFFQPTIISGMSSDMLTTQEEVFGPLLGLYQFETEEEAVRLANDTNMGLASYFFYQGCQSHVAIVGKSRGGHDRHEHCLPFGGIKASGYGKEAGKEVAIEEYLIAKTGTLTVGAIASKL
ncbi:hypothetical protein N7497_001618 [Penicillium chrysogenum]|nr:hypothetical protein N7497_001618 [Penicillium chrysogenum]